MPRNMSLTGRPLVLVYELDIERIMRYSDIDDFDSSQLYKMMNQIANMFRSYDIKKGDRVALYCPCCPMAVACMLACARIGAIHSVVFAGFSAEALASRINDCKSRFKELDLEQSTQRCKKTKHFQPNAAQW